MLSNRDRNLPEDVVNEILSRLPVKSLLRFKCVCRYWYTLIKSLDFIGKHFNQENNNGRLLVRYCISDIDRYAIALFPDETLVGIPPLHENFDHLQIPESMGHVIGPIDGMFLVYTYGYTDGNRKALWNPAMREFKLFHVLEPIFPLNFHAVVNVVGFGLDPLTRDYKIIWILNFVERIGDESGDDIDYPYYVVALYTLGKDLWRHFDLLTIPTGHFIYNSLCATCINGAYYWLCFVGNDSKYGILSFDMRPEEFREIEVPANPEQKWGSLSLYNDSIGLFFCQTYVILECSIEIWVMEEEECWIKLVTINPFQKFYVGAGFGRRRSFCLKVGRTSWCCSTMKPMRSEILKCTDVAMLLGFGLFVTKRVVIQLFP